MTEQPTCLSLSRPRAAATFGAVCAVLLAVTLGACGKSNPTGPSPNPGGGGQTFPQTITASVIGFGFTQHSVTATRAGELRAVLTWASGSVDLDLYLTDSTCTAYPPNGGCTILATSDALAGTSETVTHTVTSGQQFKLWVDSFTGGTTDYSMVVTLQ